MMAAIPKNVYTAPLKISFFFVILRAPLSPVYASYSSLRMILSCIMVITSTIRNKTVDFAVA